MPGEKIRKMRKAAGWTLRALAEKTGVSESYISQLERGLVDPSVSLLRKIAAALEVPVASFFDEDGEPPLITRREDRRQARTRDGALSFSWISPQGEGLHLEMVEVHLQPGAQLQGPAGEHYVNLLLTAGSLRMEYQDTVADLQSGDSVFIPSHTGYTLRCTGQAGAAGILCTSHGEEHP